MSVPADWALHYVGADGVAVRLSGDGVHSAAWELVGSGLRVSATGASATAAVMTVRTSTSAGTSETTYPLN